MYIEGRIGKKILKKIRATESPSDEKLRKEAEACKKRLMDSQHKKGKSG